MIIILTELSYFRSYFRIFIKQSDQTETQMRSCPRIFPQIILLEIISEGNTIVCY